MPADDFPTRLSVAGQAVGAGRPQLAATLASSDLSHGEIQAVGGFASALTLASSARLAADSGATTNYDGTERNQLDAVKQPYNQSEDEPDDRSFLEQATDKIAGWLSNTGNALVHNWASDKLFEGLDWLGDAAHMPFRLLSDGLDQSNNDEIDQQMEAAGYDPDSTSSYYAFMFNQGERQYHGLATVRDQYGDDLVDLAQQQLADPEAFQASLEKMDPQAAADLTQKLNSAEYQQAFDAVDAHHISPGRDLARVLTLGHTDNEAFTLLSGSLDAAYSWFADPTLILGKANAAIKGLDALGRIGENASLGTRVLNKAVGSSGYLANKRAGLQDMTDQAGIDHLLRTENGQAVTKVGKGWERFLADAKDLREQHDLAKSAATPAAKAAAEAKRAGIYRGMVNRYGQDLMPLLDDVNGTRVISEAERGAKVDGVLAGTGSGGHITTKAEPIEDLDQLAKYLGSTDGLIRLRNGMGARGSVVMPGRLSYWAENKAAGETRAGKKASKWINYARGSEFLPHESELELLTGPAAVTAGKAQNELLQRSIFTSARAARAKAERVSRRFTTLLPKVTHIDLTDQNSSRMVEQFSRFYLNKGDSARLASAYALGDVAERRQIVKGMLTQSFHAAGLGKSEAGRAFMDRYLGEAVEGNLRQQYGLGGTSRILTEDRGTIEGALYQSQLSTKVLLPSMRELNYTATKFAVGGFAGRTGFAHVRAMGQSSGMDSLLGIIKMGWITTAAGGLRNALDEIGNFAAYGMSGQVLAGRVAFSQATKDLRAVRRQRSSEYLKLVKEQGRADADEHVANRMGAAIKSHEDAKLDLERARKGELDLANAENLHVGRKQKLNDRHAAATENLRQIRMQIDATPAEHRAELVDQLRAGEDELRKAEERLTAHANEPKPKPGEQTAKVQQQLDDRGVLSVAEAERRLKAAEREREHARSLETAIRHRVPLFLRGAADNMNDVLITPVLGKALSVFGRKWKLTPERVKWASELTDLELSRVLREGVMQSHYADEAGQLASDHGAMDLHRAGLMARKYGYAQRYLGWGEIEPDGGAGLDAWAKTLGLRFTDPTEVSHAWVQTIRRMTAPGAKIDGPALESAKAAVRARLDEEDLRHFVKHAEVFQQTRAGVKVGSDERLLAQAKDEYADRVSGDLLLALGHGKDGSVKIHEDLLDMLAKGEVPDRSWLAGIPTDQRPEHTIGQLWAPYNPAHQPGGFPTGYTPMLTKAYDKVVTDQINALSRNPLLTALYMNARKNTAGYERKLIEAGWDEHAAEEVAKRVALQHAEDEALKHIDNPYVSSQASLVMRNYAAFVRAQEDWLRRWGRTIRDNPQMIRQAQLLIHGGTSAGLLEKDSQTGELTFVYPGSGLMLNAFGKLFGIHGEENGAQVPLSGELTSKLTYVNPSLDNPAGLSATPLISLPLKLFSKFLGPDHALLTASLDKAVNGDLGAGKEWYESVLPSWVNRIIGGVISDDPGSKYGAWYTQAVANLEAAGMLDDPKYQTPSGKAHLQHALSVQIRNMATANALFGFFAPAAPTLNPGASGTAGKFQGNEADWSAHVTGLSSLKEEARQVFARLPYEEALAWWTKVHPNELIYAQTGASSRTTVGTNSASAPATVKAARWMEQNTAFTSKYGGKGGIAAFFIPQGEAGTVNGSYSDVAYRAQLESGIRDYKSLDDYFDDVVTARGASMYFAAKDDYDAKRARAEGSPSTIKALDDEWDAKKAELYAGNPLLAAKFATSAVDNSQLGVQMAQLIELAKDTSPETVKAVGRNRDGILQLLHAYEAYQQTVGELGDRRGNAANRQRQQAKDTYEASILAITGAGAGQSLGAPNNSPYPELADLARGVFRLP